MDPMHSVIPIAQELYVALVNQVSVCLWEAQNAYHVWPTGPACL